VGVLPPSTTATPSSTPSSRLHFRLTAPLQPSVLNSSFSPPCVSPPSHLHPFSSATMFSFDTVTRLVVGRAAADRSEYKRLERKYKGAEANLKLVREVTKASTTASSARTCGVSSRRRFLLTLPAQSRAMATACAPGPPAQLHLHLHRAVTGQALMSQISNARNPPRRSPPPRQPVWMASRGHTRSRASPSLCPK
jgi:hypothetical protein